MVQSALPDPAEHLQQTPQQGNGKHNQADGSHFRGQLQEDVVRPNARQSVIEVQSRPRISEASKAYPQPWVVKVVGERLAERFVSGIVAESDDDAVGIRS